jgi:hypothetical protein
MSRGLICDACGATLAVDDRGEDEAGESACWIEVRTTFGRFDLCTRACVVTLMEDEDFVAHVDAGAEAVAEVVRAIAAAHDEEDEDE